MIDTGSVSPKMEVLYLRGWFLKEKRDKFKRRGARSNRRWFTIENIANPFDKDRSELALCYYKRSSESEDRCGWMFLNDVFSLSQDAASKWITIEHPSRVLRIQSPTPAQHRVWFSTLSKCCKNIRKEISIDMGPSLSHFMKAMPSPVKRNFVKEAVISTPTDELRFLREITGQGDCCSDDLRARQPGGSKGTTLFESTNTDGLSVVSMIDSKDDKGQFAPARCHCSATSASRSIAELDATGAIIYTPSQLELAGSTSGILRTPTQPKVTEEEKLELEPLGYNGADDEVCSFNENSVDSTDFSNDEATQAPAKKQFLLDDSLDLETAIKTKGIFGMTAMQLALEKNNRSCASDDRDASLEDTIEPLNENGFSISTSFFQQNDTRPNVSETMAKESLKGPSFSSAYSRSSLYQFHFENDDHDIKADENFVTDDWDE